MEPGMQAQMHSSSITHTLLARQHRNVPFA
jgi:hypothetical protein